MPRADETNQPRTVGDAPPQCDQKSAADAKSACPNAAALSYLWDWGEKGVCCQQHMMLLQQTSGNLGRGVNFVPLVAAAPAPITRDERARLKGEVYALTEEIEEHKGRGLDLYRENTRLTEQLQALTVRHRETDLQLKDAKRLNEDLQEKIDERDAEHGNLVDELERLRVLTKFSEPKRSELGLGESGETTTVDG